MMERIPRLRQPMGRQTRSLHPTTHQELPPMTSTSPSTLQSIKRTDHFLPKQQWPATNTTLALIRNAASFPDSTFPQESWLHLTSIPPPSYVPTPLYPHRLSLQRPNPKRIASYSYLDPLTPSLITPTSIMTYPNPSPATWSATSTVHKRRTSSKPITNYPLLPSPPQISLPTTLRNALPGGTSEGEPQQEQLRN